MAFQIFILHENDLLKLNLKKNNNNENKCIYKKCAQKAIIPWEYSGVQLVS